MNLVHCKAQFALRRGSLIYALMCVLPACQKNGVSSSPGSSLSPVSPAPSQPLLPASQDLLDQMNLSDAQFFVTPSNVPSQGHQFVASAIRGAQSSVLMTIFHLTDSDVVQALENRAEAGLEVKVILDQSSLTAGSSNWKVYQKMQTDLQTYPNFQVIKSSTSFNLTHEKAFVIDRKTAFIMSMNLSGTNPSGPDFTEMRDYAVETSHASIVANVISVFNADWSNAQQSPELGLTPSVVLSNSSLIWSPVNSESSLSQLINSAQSTVVATVENLGDASIASAFEHQARDLHHSVEIIVPQCDLNDNPLFNYPYLEKLASSGVQTEVMPVNASLGQYYMHAKMVLIDFGTAHEQAYIGSVNFSETSTQKNRELGIFFTNATLLQQLNSIFLSDWKKAVPPPASPIPTTLCSSAGTRDPASPGHRRH